MTAPNQENDLAGKVAIVTGAASGIGRATVELFVERGVRVVATDLDEAVQEIAGTSVTALVADVSKEGSARRAVELAREQFGRLDILVNNAGIIINKTVAEMSLDEWNSILAVNATGAFLHSREAVRAMIPQKSGAIVNVGSYACFQSFPTIAAYAASKGALAQLTRTLALEVIEHGIRVNAVGSGDVVTHILDDIHDDGPGFLADHGSTSPIGRAAQPYEIAQIIAFLASDQAAYVVGSIVMADGGMSVAVG